MASAIDVANFFIDVAKDSDDPMTHLRVQKLLYFAQGWSLACLGRPLFSDDTEAWQHGPVVPSVYHEFSSHGREQIRCTKDDYSGGVFTGEEIEFLTDIAMKYRFYSTGWLVSLCHAQGGAWETVQDSHISKVIPTDLIREEFASKGPLDRFDIKSALEKVGSIGYRDSEGYTVLPKELDE
ncbi:MAG: DUF4065 domain-containing protein [Candidatus Methanoplasma sp.]|jgi:uncharacterized phage-associated protein|nr:DUF4065 domain-containing protein [Candidatus Methanoplasma sp.]